MRCDELSCEGTVAVRGLSFANWNENEDYIFIPVDESLRVSERAYEAGELAFLQVLVVRRNYYDSTIRFIQAQGRLAQVNANIEGLLLTGGLDAPKDYTSGSGLRLLSFGGK